MAEAFGIFFGIVTIVIIFVLGDILSRLGKLEDKEKENERKIHNRKTHDS